MWMCWLPFKLVSLGVRVWRQHWGSWLTLCLSLAGHRRPKISTLFMGRKESSVFRAQAASLHRHFAVSSVARHLGLLEVPHETSNVTTSHTPLSHLFLMMLANLILYLLGWRTNTLWYPSYVKTSSSSICCYLILHIRAHFSKLYLTSSSYFLLPVLAFHLTFPLGYIFLAGLLPKWSEYFSSN